MDNSEERSNDLTRNSHFFWSVNRIVFLFLVLIVLLVLLLFVKDISLRNLSTKKDIANTYIVVAKDPNNDGEVKKGTINFFRINTENINDIVPFGSFNFSSNSKRNPKNLRNFMFNKYNNAWYFFEHTQDNNTWICIKIKYNETLDKLDMNTIFNKKQFKYNNDEIFTSDDNIQFIIFYTGIDKEEKHILSDSGFILDIVQERCKNWIDIPKEKLPQIFCKPNKAIDFNGSIFIDEKNTALQISEVQSFTLIFLSDTNEKYKGVLKERYGLAHTGYDYKIPMDISFDNKKLAFLTNQTKSLDNQKLNLLIINLPDRKVVKICSLPDGSSINRSDGKNYAILKWGKCKNANYIALENMYHDLLIVDIDTEEVIRKIRKKFLTKSLRWSPDGKRIGLLNWEGEFYVYDLEKDSLVKIAEDKDYFDFFWVNRKKNSVEKVGD